MLFLLLRQLQVFFFHWFCCLGSGPGSLTVEAVCLCTRSALAALTVEDMGASPCLLLSLVFLNLLICISPCFDLPFCCSQSASFAPLHFPSFTFPISSYCNPPYFLVCSHSLASVSCPFSPPIPHNHLPPPFPLAKVHAINQKKMSLFLCFAVEESYWKSSSTALLRYSTCQWWLPSYNLCFWQLYREI